MNSHLLTGTVDTDPQTFKVGDDKSKVTFRLAEVGGKSWHTIVVWQGDAALPAKGDLVFVEGRVATRNYDKDGAKVYITETVARSIEVLNGSGPASSPARQPAPAGDLFAD